MEPLAQPVARRHWLQRQPAYAFCRIIAKPRQPQSETAREDRTTQV